MPREQRPVSRIIRTAEQIRDIPAPEANALTYWPRGLLQITLPHSKPKDPAWYARRSGDFYLTIEAGSAPDINGHRISYGIPYGSYPRLVMAYLNREVKRHGDPKIGLGSSLSAFMAELGIIPTGGRWGSITNLKKQVSSLLNARIAFGYQPPGADIRRNRQIADDYALWWHPTTPGQGSIMPSFVTLNNTVFQEMLEYGIPLDMRALNELKQSPLALDLYAWATYRVLNLKDDTPIPFKALHQQFGANYAQLHDFTSALKREMRRIAVLYPDLKFSYERGRMIIRPSRTHVLVSRRKRDLGKTH